MIKRLKEYSTLRGLLDAAVPVCAARKEYYRQAEFVGYDGAIHWLRTLPGVNLFTLDLLEKFVQDNQF